MLYNSLIRLLYCVMIDKSDLLEFYGTECPHCIRMHSLVEKLEKETGKKVTKYEVWHNPENARLMKKYDKNCGGVPFFYNEKSGMSICGEAPYDLLKEWSVS